MHAAWPALPHVDPKSCHQCILVGQRCKHSNSIAADSLRGIDYITHVDRCGLWQALDDNCVVCHLHGGLVDRLGKT